MNSPQMARIRGYASLGRFDQGSRFLQLSNVGFARADRLHPIRFPRALLASTDPGSLAVEKLGRSRFGVVCDGYTVAKRGATSRHAVIDAFTKLGFPACTKTWQGDFAISLYDESSHTLFLARDRIGVRPLYYVAKRDWIAFSSQPLPLTSLPEVGREPNPVFLGLYAGCHYRTFDNDPHASPYRNVRQLPAGHWLRWCAGTWEVQRYWNLADHGDLQESEEELARQYRKKFFNAVQRDLEIAKNPGFLLSGGMDSSSVLSAAVRLTGRKQRAYSSTYTDSMYDESEEIRTILDSKVSHWCNVRVEDKRIFETIRRMVKIHEEPVATATWLSHYEVCRQASENGAGCLFTGLGGDELNAGEYEHFIFFFVDLHRIGKHSALRREIRAWQRFHDHPIHRKNKAIAMNMIRKRSDPLISGSVLPDKKLFFRYLHCMNPESFDLSLFRPVLDRLFEDSLKNRCYHDIFRETAPCCLRAQDRHGWAFGLPHYNPFYDYELVEFMFQIPGTMKIHGGVTKHLLRKAMQGIVPESTRSRVKKTGWNAPADMWFTGKNGEMLKDMLRSQSVKNKRIYKIPEVDKIIDEHNYIVKNKLKRENHMMFLWQLANLAYWVNNLEKH